MPAPKRPERQPLANSTATPVTPVAPSPAPAVVLGATTPGTPATPRTLADEVANPAGPPEGTEHGHAGDGPEPTPPATLVDPTPLPTAQVVEAAPRSTGSPSGRLVAYLATHHPAEVGRVTPEGPEHPADTAVRLLTRLGALGAHARCAESYCNLPTGHLGEHGWVHA